MIIYNVTVSIDDEVHDEWLSWMKDTHIPDVMNTGLFVEYKMCRVISHQEEGNSYSIQYTCEDMKTLHQYQSLHAQRLQAEHSAKYGGKFAAFRTLLEII
jgi:hypothetical protein